MKVIKSGILPGNVTMIGACFSCNCQIECEKNEAAKIDNKFMIRCPTKGCPNLIEVYEKTINKRT